MRWLILLSLSSQLVHARWMKRSEAGVVVEKYQIVYDVNEDGSSVQTVDSVIFVQGEDGKLSASLFTIDYNSATDVVEVVEAFTQNGKSKVPVESSMVEDRDKGNAKDYDALKTRSLAFPQVQIGSRLHIRYRLITKKAVLRDRWTAEVNLGPGGFIDKVHVIIKSKLPLHYKLIDPEKWVWIEQKSSYHIEIKNKKTLPGWVHAEKEPYFHPSRFSRIFISTETDWPKYMATLQNDVEKVLNSPLPVNLKNWLKSLSRSKKNSDEQILEVMEFISREFHYFGDWRRHDGGVVPRSLEEIDKSRFGDCKDLSTVLIAMLRSMKIDAQMALIRRGSMDWLEEPSYELPSLGYFNHAIVRAKVGDKTYWLDATNPVVSTQSFSDIAGRPAWVISSTGGSFERLPTLAAKAFVHKQVHTYEFQKDDMVKVVVNAELNGMAPFRVSNQLMMQSRSEVLSEMLEYLTEGNETQSHRYLKEPATNRRLAPVQVALEYLTNRVTYVAGKEAFFVVPDGTIGAFFETDNRESDMRLSDEPYLFQVERRLKNTELRQAMPGPCRVESPWLNMERKISVEGRDVVISQNVELKMPYVLQAEFNSPAFKKLQKQTRECFYHSGILVGENAKP